MCFGSGAQIPLRAIFAVRHSLVTSRTWSEMRESYVN
jgi:hypothetical protein